MKSAPGSITGLGTSRINHQETACDEPGRHIVRFEICIIKPEAEERTGSVKIYPGTVVKDERYRAGAIVTDDSKIDE